MEFKFPGLLDVMTTSVSGSSDLSQDTNFLKCKQVQLSVAAKLCVCLLMPRYGLKFLRRLIPWLTQTRSGLATVGVGPASWSSGAPRWEHGQSALGQPCPAPAPALPHSCSSPAAHEGWVSPRSTGRVCRRALLDTAASSDGGRQSISVAADKHTVFFNIKVTDDSLRRLLISQMVRVYSQVQKQAN